MVHGILSLPGLCISYYFYKGTKFAYCKLGYCHFTVSHSGIHVDDFILTAKSTN